MAEPTANVPAETIVRLVQAWRLDPEAAQPCPAGCTTPIEITDRSARPHAEWYVLSCPGCGFEYTLHIPLAAPPLNGM